MSGAAALQRRKIAMMMAGIAALAVVVGAVSFLPPSQPKPRAEVGEKVLPGFAANAAKVQLVSVTTSEESYHLKSTPTGWVIPEKGSYPVDAEKVAELIRSLSTIAYARPMTRDDKKFDRIGLGDPGQGGTGALVEVGDGSGAAFAKLLIGYRDGKSYVRMPDDLQAWSVSGEPMPPLQRGARWLDLDIATVPADQIAEVQVRPQGGPTYRLLPEDATGQKFKLAPPYYARRLVTAYAPTLTAAALSRFSPVDVAPAPGIAAGAPLAEHITRTRSGVAIVVRSWKAGGKNWVTVDAAVGEAASPAAVAQAQAINAHAAGWAFALTDLDWGNFSTQLSALVD
ncbi:MAG TPA: DUF4340 domain-containing protein [Hyphomonadaceae bacterium]|nr:DUF4340 domain-containing protein [Hyphomonadaceae bacterium]